MDSKFRDETLSKEGGKRHYSLSEFPFLESFLLLSSWNIRCDASLARCCLASFLHPRLLWLTRETKCRGKWVGGTRRYMLQIPYVVSSSLYSFAPYSRKFHLRLCIYVLLVTVDNECLLCINICTNKWYKFILNYSDMFQCLYTIFREFASCVS